MSRTSFVLGLAAIGALVVASLYCVDKKKKPQNTSEKKSTQDQSKETVHVKTEDIQMLPVDTPASPTAPVQTKIVFVKETVIVEENVEAISVEESTEKSPSEETMVAAVEETTKSPSKSKKKKKNKNNQDKAKSDGEGTATNYRDFDASKAAAKFNVNAQEFVPTFVQSSAEEDPSVAFGKLNVNAQEFVPSIFNPEAAEFVPTASSETSPVLKGGRKRHVSTSATADKSPSREATTNRPASAPRKNSKSSNRRHKSRDAKESHYGPPQHTLADFLPSLDSARHTRKRSKSEGSALSPEK